MDNKQIEMPKKKDVPQEGLSAERHIRERNIGYNLCHDEFTAWLAGRVDALETLRQEYALQDNRSTAYPIYVTVQELFCVGVMADDYSVNCPYGDGETITKYRHIDADCDAPEFNSIKELEEYYKENELDIHPEDIQEYRLGYIWHDVEFFLTIKGAEEYMKANAHNHGKLRTYVKWFEDRNFEMRGLLENLGFKVKD